MITESFDNLSQAIINPVRKENAPAVDASGTEGERPGGGRLHRDVFP